MNLAEVRELIQLRPPQLGAAGSLGDQRLL